MCIYIYIYNVIVLCGVYYIYILSLQIVQMDWTASFWRMPPNKKHHQPRVLRRTSMSVGWEVWECQGAFNTNTSKVIPEIWWIPEFLCDLESIWIWHTIPRYAREHQGSKSPEASRRTAILWKLPRFHDTCAMMQDGSNGVERLRGGMFLIQKLGIACIAFYNLYILVLFCTTFMYTVYIYTCIYVYTVYNII